MKPSGILKWAQNTKNSNGKNKDKGKSWVHSPDTLLKGHVAYLVKFLGSTAVDQPKGIEVVKQGIQKLKFKSQLAKSDGNKTPKVELTISVDGIAIRDPKTRKMLHQYQLQKISYCADDKAEKRFFSFIAKEQESDSNTCFVFVSDKLAEEITLTIGQAFELAYKRFLETNGREMEIRKQMTSLQKRVNFLEKEAALLRSRVLDIAAIKGQQDIQEYMKAHKLKDVCQVNVPDEEDTKEIVEMPEDSAVTYAHSNEGINISNPNKLIWLEEEVVGGISDLDKLTIDDLNDNDFNPRANDDEDFDPRGSSPNNDSTTQPSNKSGPQSPLTILPPPPVIPPRDPLKINTLNNNNIKDNSFAQSPTEAVNPFFNNTDLFGIGSFNMLSDTMKPTTGNWNIDELDPLKQ